MDRKEGRTEEDYLTHTHTHTLDESFSPQKASNLYTLVYQQTLLSVSTFFGSKVRILISKLFLAGRNVYKEIINISYVFYDVHYLQRSN
jgi:hypothetical protein